MAIVSDRGEPVFELLDHHRVAAIGVRLARLVLVDTALPFPVAQLPLHNSERVVARRHCGVKRALGRQLERHEGRRRRTAGRCRELRQQRVEVEQVLDHRGRRRQWRRLRFDRLLDRLNCSGQIRIVLRQLQRATVVHERVAHQAAPLIDLGQGTNRGEVARGRIEDECQLGEGVVKFIELDERAAERNPRCQVVRMMNEAGAADANRFFVRAGAPALFSELRENQRRRVLLDPASKLENAWFVCHVPVSVVERPQRRSPLPSLWSRHRNGHRLAGHRERPGLVGHL